LIGKSQGKICLERSENRLEDNNKIGLKIGCEDANRIEVDKASFCEHDN
jgi:hypothetical protein